MAQIGPFQPVASGSFGVVHQPGIGTNLRTLTGDEKGYMDVQRSNRFGTLAESHLADFEQSVGFRFPDDFREFLLAHNGGRPEKHDVFLPGEKDAFDTLHHTYGLHDGPNYFRLDRAYEIHKPFLPSTLIAFADDPGGNAYCIGVGGEHTGKIYFWDHESGPNYRLKVLAESFTAFLEQLGDADES